MEDNTNGGIGMKLDLEDFKELGKGMVKKPKYSEDIEYGNVYISADNNLYIIVHENGDRTLWHVSEGMKFISNGGR